jgi:hypothetical protein
MHDAYYTPSGSGKPEPGKKVLKFPMDLNSRCGGSDDVNVKFFVPLHLKTVPE